MDAAESVAGRRWRVLLCSTHLIQYNAPLYRHLARDGRFDVSVAYLSDPRVTRLDTDDFGTRAQWDVPLLEGYPWKVLANHGTRGGTRKFWGILNPGLWSLIRRGAFDAVVVPGYAYASCWIAWLAARSRGTPVLIGSDSISLKPVSGRWWRGVVKRRVLPWIMKRFDGAIVLSSASREFHVRELGLSGDRVALCPYAVDNDRFKRAASEIPRSSARDRFGLPQGARVVLFSGKLYPGKRPLDVLQAVIQLRDEKVWLLVAGEGPDRGAMEREAAGRGFSRVRFAGFVNQSGMPWVYRASDVLVLSSEAEAFGLVVNEAMASGLPVVVSDRVGAGRDLVEPGRSGWIYPVGAVESLTVILRAALGDPARLQEMGRAAAERIDRWSYREHADGFYEAINRVAEQG